MPNRYQKDLYLTWINDSSSGFVAWNVVIPYRKNGKRHVWRHAVSQARYGANKAKLKRIAIEIRNRKLLEFRSSAYELFESKRYVGNTSGTAGVRETIDVDRSGKRHMWEARWIGPNGKTRRRTFVEKSQQLPGPLRSGRQDGGAGFLNAGSVISTDGVDGLNFSAESERKLGVAIAGKVKEISP
jgi:hypothetical protein